MRRTSLTPPTPTEKARTLSRLPPKGGVMCVARPPSHHATPTSKEGAMRRTSLNRPTAHRESEDAFSTPPQGGSDVRSKALLSRDPDKQGGGNATDITDLTYPPTEKARTLSRLPPKGGVMCVARPPSHHATPTSKEEAMRRTSLNRPTPHRESEDAFSTPPQGGSDVRSEALPSRDPDKQGGGNVTDITEPTYPPPRKRGRFLDSPPKGGVMCVARPSHHATRTSKEGAMRRTSLT